MLTGGSRARTSLPLRQLHWLPVSFSTGSKILLLVYKVLSGLCSSYFTELLSSHHCARPKTSVSRLVRRRVIRTRRSASLPSTVKYSHSQVLHSNRGLQASDNTRELLQLCPHYPHNMISNHNNTDCYNPTTTTTTNYY